MQTVCLLSLCGVIAMPATVAQAQTQTVTEAPAVPAKTGDESEDRKRVGYFTAAAVAVGVALTNRGSSHGSQSFGNLTSGNTGTTVRRHNSDIPSDSSDFASTGSGTVLVTSPSLPPVDNIAGSAATDGDAVPVPTPSLAGSTPGLSPAGLPGIGSTDTQIPELSLLPATSGAFTSLDSARVSSAAAIASSPEPGEWVAMGMMGMTVLGLMARAKRANSAKTSQPITGS
jgi:hypothetical protein